MSRAWCGSIGAGLLLVTGVVAAGGAATPQMAFKEFQAAVKAKDGDKAWKLLSREGQGQLNDAVKLMKEQFKKFEKLPPEQLKAIDEQFAKVLGMSMTELQKMDGKRLFSFSLKNAEKLGKGGDALQDIATATLEDVKVDGDKATATVKTKKKSDPVRFMKEGGSWKLTPPPK